MCVCVCDECILQFVCMGTLHNTVMNETLWDFGSASAMNLRTSVEKSMRKRREGKMMGMNFSLNGEREKEGEGEGERPELTSSILRFAFHPRSLRAADGSKENRRVADEDHNIFENIAKEKESK